MCSDARIADLRTIRGTLVAALEAGCDDLAACASSSACPLPFAELAGGDPTGPAAGEDPAGPATGSDAARWSIES